MPVFDGRPGRSRAVEGIFSGAALVEPLVRADGTVAGYTVTLTNDISRTVEVPDDLGPLTFDLNGWTVAGTNGAPAVRVVKGGSHGLGPTRLTVTDGLVQTAERAWPADFLEIDLDRLGETGCVKTVTLHAPGQVALY